MVEQSLNDKESKNKITTMTQNQKIAIGLGAVALGYWLYTKNKASKSTGTTATPSTTGTTTFEPPTSSLPKKINVHTCKDGFKINVPDYGNMMTFAKLEDPCRNHGGTVNYMPIENAPPKNIKLESCQSNLANVRMTPQGYDNAISECMGCPKGQLYTINSANGKLGCITPRTDGRF